MLSVSHCKFKKSDLGYRKTVLRGKEAFRVHPYLMSRHHVSLFVWGNIVAKRHCSARGDRLSTYVNAPGKPKAERSDMHHTATLHCRNFRPRECLLPMPHTKAACVRCLRGLRHRHAMTRVCAGARVDEQSVRLEPHQAVKQQRLPTTVNTKCRHLHGCATGGCFMQNI